jgi:hypothetical protein
MFGAALAFGAGLLTPPRCPTAGLLNFEKPLVALFGSVRRPSTTRYVRLEGLTSINSPHELVRNLLHDALTPLRALAPALLRTV